MSLETLGRDRWGYLRIGWVRVVFVVLFAQVIVFLGWLLFAPDIRSEPLWNIASYLGIEAASAVIVGIRAILIRRERLAWAFMCAALAFLTVGDSIESLSVPLGEPQPNADASQVFYFFFVTFFATSIGVLARLRLRRVPNSIWLDLLIAAFGLLAVVSYIVVAPTDAVVGSVLIELLYTAAPLLFLVTLLSSLAVIDRSPGTAWTLQFAASLLMVTSNLALASSIAGGQYLITSPIDALWPLATALVALSAWSAPWPSQIEGSRFRALVVAPAAFCLCVLGVLVINELSSGAKITDYFGYAALAAGLVRLVLAVTDTERLRRREESLNTALERARDEALAAARAKTSFLATMSHEIRTPLSAVLGLNSLLFETDLTETQRNYAEKVAQNGALLLELITDILDFSKIDAGAVQLERRAFDLRALVANSTAVLSYAAKLKSIELITEVSSDCPQLVLGDVTRLRQVLVNLIANAVKFTTTGEVTVTASAGSSHGMIRFDVVDTGIGIHEQQLENLFTPFTQADASTTREHGGTGLGLSICSSLVELMGGHIGVTSIPGVGSTFFFEVELEQTSAKLEGAEPMRPIGQSSPSHVDDVTAESLHFLVAEDNDSLQLLSTLFLNRLGYSVDSVETGTAAVDAVMAGRYDVVLMDVHMPLMDGIEATTQIRAAGNAIVQPRIIALTASATMHDRDACLAAGMDYYLSKPFTIQDLKTALVVVLSESAAVHDAVAREEGMSFEYLDELPRDVRDDILRSFISHSGDDFLLLEHAVMYGDAEEIRFVAHKMRGSSLVIGATELADFLLALERQDSDGARNRALIADARRALDQVVQSIELELSDTR